MKRMEVRCCCRPTKVLGTLPIGDDVVWVGTTIKYPLKVDTTRHPPPRPPRHLAMLEFTVERWADVLVVDADLAAASDWQMGVSKTTGLALKREGVTLEQLRLVSGFVEAI